MIVKPKWLLKGSSLFLPTDISHFPSVLGAHGALLLARDEQVCGLLGLQHLSGPLGPSDGSEALGVIA